MGYITHPDANTRRNPSRNGLHFAASSLAIIAGLTIASAPALAQDNPQAGSADRGLAEIVVTAQRRGENLQTVPIAVQAVSAEQLAAGGVGNVRDLGVVAPSLQFADIANWGTITLRGVGTPAQGPGVESPVALYIDGVYMASMLGSDLELNDVQSVEVINGPQGTLFGRNATGGLVNVRTKDPASEFGGRVSLGYGNYETGTGDIYVTGPLGDKVSFAVAGQFQNQGKGYGHNVVTGADIGFKDFYSVRPKIMFKPNDDLTVRISGSYMNQRSAFAQSGGFPGQSTPLGGRGPIKPFDQETRNTPFTKLERASVTGSVEYNLGFATLNSITAYQSVRFEDLNVGATANPDYETLIYLKEPHDQFTQELQLISNRKSGFTWAVGAYYFNELSQFSPAAPYGGPLSGFGFFYPSATARGDIVVSVRNRTKSWALYGQSTLEVLPRTNLTVGLRYSWETRNFSDTFILLGQAGAPYIGKISDGRPQWRIALDHKFGDGTMVYASYNRGTRSGYFASPIPAELKPETLDSWETGIKSEMFDRHLRINVAGYYYKYKNIQVNLYKDNFPTFLNAAAAELYGVDVTANAVVNPNVKFDLSLGWNHSKFTKFTNAPSFVPNPNFPYGNIAIGPDGVNATGNALPRAPHFVASFAPTFTAPVANGEFSTTASVSYSSGWFAEPDNRIRQSAYTVVNLTAKWESEHGFGIAGWAKNLFDERYASYYLSSDAYDAMGWAAPRTYGVTISQKF